MKSIYLIGSLRNREIVHLENRLREKGYDPFGSWSAAGPEADDYWQEYCTLRGLTYKEALKDWSAQNVFEFDRTHLIRCDAAVLVMPSGKSAHIELGYMVGLGKPAFVLFPTAPERYDVMYNFATDVCLSEDELLDALKTIEVGQHDRSRGEYGGRFSDLLRTVVANESPAWRAVPLGAEPRSD